MEKLEFQQEGNFSSARRSLIRITYLQIHLYTSLIGMFGVPKSLWLWHCSTKFCTRWSFQTTKYANFINVKFIPCAFLVMRSIYLSIGRCWPSWWTCQHKRIILWSSFFSWIVIVHLYSVTHHVFLPQVSIVQHFSHA